LIYLTPGITGSPDQITDSPGSFGTFSMNGARGRSNNFLLDGTDMNDGYRNDPAINQPGVFGTPSTILPIDAVSEVRVLSNFEPEFGRNAGTVISIVTKSGTNSYHGNGFDYFRNNALDARNYFNTTNDPQAPFHNNQFGGSLGGPIQKDKTFFFFDYEGEQEDVGVVTTGCVPNITAADIQGANPVIRQLLLTRNPYPAPNIPGAIVSDTGCVNGPDVSLVTPSYNNLSSLIAKIDHNFNQNNVLTGRYYFGDSNQAFPLALTATGGQLPGFDTVTPTRVQLISISYVHVVSPTQVNELRYGWNRFAEGFYPQDQSFSPSSIGLCAASTTAQCTPGNPADQGLPSITILGTPLSGITTPAATSSTNPYDLQNYGGFSELGATSGDPKHRTDSNNQLIDGFSWQLGKHNVKFGGEFRRTSISQDYDKEFRGSLKFDNLLDFLSGTVSSTQTSLQYSGDSDRNSYENGFGFYGQDSYRLSSRLTFNYGLRWDYYGVVGEKNNQLSNITNYDAVDGTVTLTQVGSPGLSKLYNPDYRNFAPRVSLAWDVFGKGKTVIRSGFGIFYDAYSQDLFIGQAPYPPAFDPGPTYNPLGSAQIVPASAAGTVISSGVPIYGPAGCSSYECDIFAIDRNIRTPYMDNYNLNIEQQLANKVVLQVGYVGSEGHHLTRYFDVNQPSQAAITVCDLGNGGTVCPSYGVPRPYGNNPYDAFYIMELNTTGKSNYNALQTSLKVSNWHGVTSILNYVWSRSMDNSSDGLDFIPNAAQPNDSTNPQLEYGPSSFDTPQRFTWIFGYELPQMGGSMQRVKNGWGFDSTVSLQSGQPFNLNYNFEDDFSGSGEGDDRPDVVGPITYNTKNPAQYLNLSSFAIPCTVSDATDGGTANGLASDCVPGTRHFGDLGRNALRGPSYKQWDFAIYKNTTITERLKLQLRAEFFNILNHPNFANPVLPNWIADAGAAGFALNGNREVGGGYYPITATGDVGVGYPFLGGGGPRGIQLAAKFSF
jgi:hypothetical protein